MVSFTQLKHRILAMFGANLLTRNITLFQENNSSPLPVKILSTDGGLRIDVAEYMIKMGMALRYLYGYYCLKYKAFFDNSSK